VAYALSGEMKSSTLDDHLKVTDNQYSQLF